MNFKLHLKPDQADQLRKVTIQLVLKLDLREFFGELGMFNTKLGGDFPQENSLDDKVVVCAATLRCCYMSWNARPLQIYLRWAQRYFEEGFVQGDLEKQLGLQVSPFCDRDALANTSKVQLGLVVVLVQPLMMAYGVLLNSPEYNQEVTEEGLEANRQYLRS